MQSPAILFRFLALGCIALISLYGSSSNADPASSAEAEIFATNRFIFPSGRDVGKMQLLECPNHAFGTRTKGLEELQKRLLAKSKEKAALIEICIYYQPESMLLYAPKMDWVGLNPFASIDLKFVAPKVEKVDVKSDNYWAESAHPVLARLRLLNSTTPENCKLLARIDLTQKELGVWNKRLPTFQELRWCAVALCGAGYNGIVWVGQNDKNMSLTSAIEKEFKPISKAIVNLKPVNEPLECNGVYATLLENQDKYVLCVLSKDYVKISEGKAGDTSVNVSSTLESGIAVPFQIVLKGKDAEGLTRPAAQMLVSHGDLKDAAWHTGVSGLVLDAKLVGAANIWIWDKPKGVSE